MNYYHCGRNEVRYIGKSSAGWTFLFQGYTTIRSCADWIKIFEQGGEITNETGCVISLNNFKEIVEYSRTARVPRIVNTLYEWFDKEGNYFTDSEFS